ncbi:hypothetical protein [Agromyces allii]|uniref:hypothetical protein n=1 Tax=Agromyces allii TaxID=393607 RepID=UPI0012F8C9EF|nr:hypothetical protein [Agromyces allii]
MTNIERLQAPAHGHQQCGNSPAMVSFEVASLLEHPRSRGDRAHLGERVATPVLIRAVGPAREPLEPVVDDREPQLEGRDIGEERRPVDLVP